MTIKNYYEIFYGIVTPVQMEGLRLLLTPFPQQQFNQTEDRRSADAGLGVSCLDCHQNGHTNAAFHENPDTRPQAARFRLDTTSLRGMFNQRLHGSKRSLRSIEDFTEFEQRDGLLRRRPRDRREEGGEPARSYEPGGDDGPDAEHPRLPAGAEAGRAGPADPDQGDGVRAARREGVSREGQVRPVPPAPFFLDNEMHDLHLERFYTPETISDQYNIGRRADQDLRAARHQGLAALPPRRPALTLEDTVEFFNLVLAPEAHRRRRRPT